MLHINDEVIVIENRVDLVNLLDDYCVEDFEEIIKHRKEVYTRFEFLNRADIIYPFLLEEDYSDDCLHFNMYSHRLAIALIQDQIDKLQEQIDRYKSIIKK